MSTPTTYVVQSTGTFKTPDGRESRNFYQGDVIPMATAIAFGLPGAGYAAPPFFSEAERAAIRDLAWAAIPRWSTGRYYSLGFPPLTEAQATTATSLSANQIRAHLIVVPPGGTIDRLMIPNITVAATAGSLARMGLYEYDQAAAYPGALITDGGTVLVDATGDRTVTVDITPDPGLYVLTEVHNAAFTAPAWAASPQAPLGVVNGAGTQGVSWLNAFTFAALPDPFPAGASIQVTTMKLMARAG